jgi:hypothetical protein
VTTALDQLRTLVNADLDADIHDVIVEACNEIERLKSREHALELLDLDEDDIIGAMADHVGKTASLNEAVTCAIDRSNTLTEWQRELDDNECELADACAAYADRMPWGEIAIALWRIGLLTASDLADDPEAHAKQAVERGLLWR